MPVLSVIYWRDIPAQVVGRDDQRTSKIVLHRRFQVAIDRAASRAGRRGYSEYIGEWRKVRVRCDGDIDAAVRAESDRLETEYARHRLATLVLAGGLEGGPKVGSPVDEAQARPVRQ